LLILLVYSVVFDLHHLKFYLLTIHNPTKHLIIEAYFHFLLITLSAALECKGTPSSYLPVNKPHANGDQVIVPIPRTKKSICVLIEKSSSFSNRFYDKFPVDELRLYHVEIDDIQLVHIWVGLN
jgi:hypothetical protein